MVIHILPQSVAHLLGSSMNITTPCDLVKELLDNALDAKATAIEITISSNTIDRISVKDNGNGIDIDDFGALGRRAHTSKLREYSELTNIGGKTLGFRGEALASINTVAEVTITTKRLGDPIAWRIELVPSTGGVKDKRPVSSTVGTTVAVTKLFEKLRPRRQHALKESKRCISQVQQLLRAYVFARPNFKLSLKIIGDSKHLWTYSPKPPDLKREAILQMYGANGLASCIEIYEEIFLGRGSTSQIERQGSVPWLFSGYIPRPRYSTKDGRVRGTHLSIDRRPMSAGWNVTKKMVGILSSHLSKAAGPNFAEKNSNVFLQLDIQCPPCSYDPNITTGKDELLIYEEKGLLDGFELVCERVYETHGRALAEAHLSTTLRPQSIAISGSKELSESESATRTGTFILTSKNSGQHNNIGNGTTARNAPGATGPSIKTTAKTTFRVNMGRKEDNDSDEENMDMTVEVEIPIQPASVRDSHTAGQEQYTSSGNGSIRQYFQPIPLDGNQIACDETATAEVPVRGPIGHRLESPSPFNRDPLQPLSDIALNRIRDENESSPEPPGSDSILPEQMMDDDREETGPALRRLANITRHIVTQRPERASPSSGGPGLGPQETEDLSPSDSISLGMLTPPPTNPRYRIEQTISQSRPRLQLNNSSTVRTTGVAQQRYNEIREVSSTDTIRHGNGVDTTLSAFGLSKIHPRRVAMPRAANEELSLLVPSQRSKGHSERPRNSITTTSPSNVSFYQNHGPIRPDTRRPSFSLCNSHELQNRPIQTSASFEKTDRCNGSHESESANESLAEERMSLTSSPFQPNKKLAGTTEDSREYLIRRQRPQTHHRQVRRMSTRRLPFESIDVDKQTFTLSAVICQQAQHIQRQMHHHSALEAYITQGNLVTCLPLRDLSHTHGVHRRLQLSVRSWMKKNYMSDCVEYASPSGATDECRAE
ncbi:hypothetical protein ED733_005937 [Metarhizium rileyi]|uniref:DNA mismatch repair protein S5 domain-containing protein n=1 Tax=Metarhizium rileyi (strain RCEF 4871) TaxID=1649241 RepID=A0A5C6GM63_METRR|nr:hypothetical protein ED733_005937 [Metarhizium rileyi]